GDPKVRGRIEVERVERCEERIDLARRVHEGEVALLALVEARAPRGDLGAKLLELFALVAHDLAQVAVGQLSHRGHDPVPVRMSPLCAISDSATPKGVRRPCSSASSASSTYRVATASPHNRRRSVCSVYSTTFSRKRCRRRARSVLLASR